MGFVLKDSERRNLRKTGAEKEEEAEQEVVALEKEGGERVGFIEREVEVVMVMI